MAAPPKVQTRHVGATSKVSARAKGGELRTAREVVGRREEPLTPEEACARDIDKLLRGPLRNATTGLYVTDARTGEALFSVNADDPLNPASNVKMISTATALELLGPTFRYPTRVLGAADKGVVAGDVYLLGSYDPTLSAADLDDVAKQIAASGITSIKGNIAVGADATRDGLFKALVPIAIKGGAKAGDPVVASSAFEFVEVKVEAKTVARGKAALKYVVEDLDGKTVVTISGAIGRGFETKYDAPTKLRTYDAAFTLRAALAAHGVTVGGKVVTEELGDFVGTAVGGALPSELARHDSAQLAEIVAHVNKWSINWLADRVVMTAAALARHEQPTMENALAAMYEWLARNANIAKKDLVVDTGSGLSYNTKITAKELVAIVRGAGGFDKKTADPGTNAQAWLGSLSIAGMDGTLTNRFRGPVRGHIHGKTGTLSTAIALSGILDIDPNRPLAFSLVTNGATPLAKGQVRKTHELVVNLLVKYLAATQSKSAAPVVVAPVVEEKKPAADLEEAEPNDALDTEAAHSK